MNLPEYQDSLIDGRYRLDVELGAGAFGAVYRAVQVVLGKDMRALALKVFRGDVITPDNVEKMMNDALQILAILADLTDWEVGQHFVTVYDLGVTREKEPRGYVAMELVKGGSLEKRIQACRQFSLQGTLHYLIQIARAVAFMHEKGFVHSDLKPANILVYRGLQQQHERDLVKIGDFGLAGKYLGLFSEEGARGGTMSYMAPEQLLGTATTPAADVFSIGLIAYEMLTGKNPYNQVGRKLDRTRDDYHQQLQQMQVLSRETPITLRADDYPELRGDPELAKLRPLVDVINHMLATDATQRYATARQVYDDLQRIAASRLPTLEKGNGVQTPATPIDEKFAYHLHKKEWGEATRVAKETTRDKPDQALGYLLSAKISLGQADQAGRTGVAARAEQFRHQAIKHLQSGLAVCTADDQRQQLRQEIANVYELLGDHDTARQFRALSR